MIGPVFFLLIETSLTKGIKKAIIFDLGVLAGDLFFIAIVAYGSSFLTNIHNLVWVYLIGGLLIIGYGLYNIFSARTKKRNLIKEVPLPIATANNLTFFMKGFVLNSLNVGVFAYWLTTTITLRATFSSAPNETSLLWAYFIATIVAYFATDLVKIFAAQRIKKHLTPTFLVRIEQMVGFVLLAFGVLLIARGILQNQNMLPDILQIKAQ